MTTSERFWLAVGITAVIASDIYAYATISRMIHHGLSGFGFWSWLLLLIALPVGGVLTFVVVRQIVMD